MIGAEEFVSRATCQSCERQPADISAALSVCTKVSKNIALFLSLCVVCSLFAITGSQFEGVPWLALIKEKKNKGGGGEEAFFVLFQVNSIGEKCHPESQTKLLHDNSVNNGVASLSLFRDESQPNLQSVT